MSKHADDLVRTLRGLALVAGSVSKDGGPLRAVLRTDPVTAAQRAKEAAKDASEQATDFLRHVSSSLSGRVKSSGAGGSMSSNISQHMAHNVATSASSPAQSIPKSTSPHAPYLRIMYGSAKPQGHQLLFKSHAETFSRRLLYTVPSGQGAWPRAFSQAPFSPHVPTYSQAITTCGHRSHNFTALAPLPSLHSANSHHPAAGCRRTVSTTPEAAAPPKLKIERRKFRERAVPASPAERALGFAGLGASMAWGAATESVSRALGAGDPQSTGFLSESNARRLANGLCRMRGAALKLGQMLSIQDEDLLPPQIAAALEQVRQSADVMPRKQLEQALKSELGEDWESRVAEFDWEPFAAASIGQVHQAKLHDGRVIAVKIQYPGVADSIESDIDNLMRLMSMTNVFPKGLYVDAAVRVAKRELALECDYTYEAACQQRFRELMLADPVLSQHCIVPAVVPELSARRVIASEWVPGVPVDKVTDMPKEVRDHVGTLLLQLTLKELFTWRFMQTDPNWGNFLYDEESGKVALIDFGAAREFPKAFVDDYLRMVKACADKDRQEILLRSTRLGFLTGEESDVMMHAHVEAGSAVGTPFGTAGLYDFGSHNQLTKRVSALGHTMLKHRLTPPPEDAYSLHRRLSGAFLVNIKLKAAVPCQKLFQDVFAEHDFADAQQSQAAVA